jgi:hypothetical protein
MVVLKESGRANTNAPSARIDEDSCCKAILSVLMGTNRAELLSNQGVFAQAKLHQCAPSLYRMVWSNGCVEAVAGQLVGVC